MSPNFLNPVYNNPGMKDKQDTEKNFPSHIAIIMDGNRRWAKNKNLPTSVGHKSGVDTLKNIVRYSKKIGIKHLTVYAFSTENWKRTEEEVKYLMLLIREGLKTFIKELHEEKVRIRFIGFYKELKEPIPQELEDAMELTKDNKELNFQVALNYGSRAEIVNGIKEIATEVKEGNLSVNDISEEKVQSKLFTSDIPDPDLVIRTGGEMRISNYLLWQSAYSEFYSTKTLWPDFNESELEKAIENYKNRDRRYGK